MPTDLIIQDFSFPCSPVPSSLVQIELFPFMVRLGCRPVHVYPSRLVFFRGKPFLHPCSVANDAPVLSTASRAASLDLKPLRINVCTVRLAFPVSVIAATKPFRSLALESPTAMASTRTASIAHGSRYVMMSCKNSTPSLPKIEITSEAGRPSNQAANPSLQVGGIGSLGRKGATRQTKSANVVTASTRSVSSPFSIAASASKSKATRPSRPVVK